MSTNDSPGAVALRITKARSLSGMTQNELADKSGIAAAQISRYETGRNIPRMEVIAKLASTLGVSFDWLSYGDAEEEEAKRLPQDEDKYIVRFEDEGMREKIKSLAKGAGRTINKEINMALRMYVANAGVLQAQSGNLSDADVERIAMRIAELIKIK